MTETHHSSSRPGPVSLPRSDRKATNRPARCERWWKKAATRRTASHHRAVSSLRAPASATGRKSRGGRSTPHFSWWRSRNPRRDEHGAAASSALQRVPDDAGRAGRASARAPLSALQAGPTRLAGSVLEGADRPAGLAAFVLCDWSQSEEALLLGVWTDGLAARCPVPGAAAPIRAVGVEGEARQRSVGGRRQESISGAEVGA